MDLSGLNHEELLALRERIEDEIVSRRDRERDDALKAIREIAARAGLSPTDIAAVVEGKTTTGARRNARRNSQPIVKFRNPDNPSQTWSGRGRRPHWIEQALSAGRSMDDLRTGD